MINKELDLLIQPYLRKNIHIDENTYINKDLDIYGKQAIILLETYSKKFKVNISDFEFEKYFSEDINRNMPLSIGDMERGIALGVLNDDIIKLEDGDQNLPPRFSIKRIILGFILCILFAFILCIVAYYL